MSPLGEALGFGRTVLTPDYGRAQDCNSGRLFSPRFWARPGVKVGNWVRVSQVKGVRLAPNFGGANPLFFGALSLGWGVPPLFFVSALFGFMGGPYPSGGGSSPLFFSAGLPHFKGGGSFFFPAPREIFWCSGEFFPPPEMLSRAHFCIPPRCLLPDMPSLETGWGCK